MLCTDVWERSLLAYCCCPSDDMNEGSTYIQQEGKCQVCRKLHFCQSSQGADDITEVPVGHSMHFTHQPCAEVHNMTNLLIKVTSTELYLAW